MADLEQWFQAHVELQKRFKMTRSCLFGTVGSEWTKNDGLIRQDLGLLFEVMTNKLATFFVREKAQGRLCKDANEEHLAAFCIATIQGAMLMGKIVRNSQTVDVSFSRSLDASEALCGDGGQTVKIFCSSESMTIRCRPST